MGILQILFGKPEQSKSSNAPDPAVKDAQYDPPKVEEPEIPECDLKFYKSPEYYTAVKPSFALDSDNGTIRVTTFSERKFLSYPSERGLYVGEILLLHYCTFGDYPNPKHGYPSFWWFDYGMKNIRFYLESLADRGFIQLNADNKYELTDIGKQELKDNYYVVYMQNPPGRNVSNMNLVKDFSVWGINKRLAGGDPKNWESVLMQIWNEIDAAEEKEKQKENARLASIGINPEKYSSAKKPLSWNELGFRNNLERTKQALEIKDEEATLLPDGYAKAIMRRVLDSFLVIERSYEIKECTERLQLIEADLKQLSCSELAGTVFDFSPSYLLFSVKKNQNAIVAIVIENSMAKQMDKICSLKTDRGREKSNAKWRDTNIEQAEPYDNHLKEFILYKYSVLEKSRENLSES